MRIVRKDGRAYTLTQNDLLWAARAAKYEGGSPAASLWAWAWRFMVNGSGSGSFANLVRAHSQPVNPLWDEATDEKCIANPDRCTPAALARRHEAATATWESLPRSITSLVTSWAEARVPNPAPRANNFADAEVSRYFLSRPANAGATVVLRDGNWYIAERNTQALPADYVTIEHAGSIAGPVAAGGSLLFLGALGALGYAWWRARR
jgi:hypothetical protein